jgi:hypothetical protein
VELGLKELKLDLPDSGQMPNFGRQAASGWQARCQQDRFLSAAMRVSTADHRWLEYKGTSALKAT